MGALVALLLEIQVMLQRLISALGAADWRESNAHIELAPSFLFDREWWRLDRCSCVSPASLQLFHMRAYSASVSFRRIRAAGRSPCRSSSREGPRRLDRLCRWRCPMRAWGSPRPLVGHRWHVVSLDGGSLQFWRYPRDVLRGDELDGPLDLLGVSGLSASWRHVVW